MSRMVLALGIALVACTTRDLPSGASFQGDGGRITGATGPCSPWQTRECGVELGSQGGVTQCQRGHQTCENGYWGACMTDSSLVIQELRVPASGIGTVRMLAVGGGSVACAANPCDPACQTFQDTTDGGITTPLSDAGPVVIGGGSLSGSNVPSGFQSKGSDPNAVCTPGCTSLACSAACQYDMHCSTTTPKRCDAFGITQSGSCNGVDVTAGVGCETADGLYRVFAVCNRGTQPSPAGIRCYTFPGNSQQMPSMFPNMTNATLIATTTAPLAAGTCETLRIPDTSPPFDNNGAQEVICRAPAGTLECNPFNDWSATKGNPAYACSVLQGPPPIPSTETRVFQAACPAGSGPTWLGFGYSTSTPTGTSVAFRFRSFASTNGVCTALPPVTADPPVPVATASTTQDPQSCPAAGGVVGCPRALDTYLGFPDSTYDCLQMDAQLTPSTTVGPVLYDWTVSYDCQANR